VGFAFFWIWLHAICKTLLCLNCFSSMNSSHCIWFQNWAVCGRLLCKEFFSQNLMRFPYRSNQ
jgi:hypothetical protein